MKIFLVETHPSWAFNRTSALKVFFLIAFVLWSGSAFGDAPKFDDSPYLLKPEVKPPMLSATNNVGSSNNLVGTNALSATNSASAGVTNSMDALDDKYKLATGDRLSFKIVQDEEEAKVLLVTDSGDLEVPYLGRLPVVGKTCKQLAKQLKTDLEKDYYYHATVMIAVDAMTRNRGLVYLVGPVHNPGPQEIPSDEVFTLSKAILRAGSFGDFADQKNVKVTRKSDKPGGTNETFIVNVNEILEHGKTDQDIVLEPGDLIYVPERLIRF